MTSSNDVVLVSVGSSEDGRTVAELPLPDGEWDVVEVSGGYDGYVDVRLRYGPSGVVSVELVREGRVIGSLDAVSAVRS